jgi:hypothetical protein
MTLWRVAGFRFSRSTGSCAAPSAHPPRVIAVTVAPASIVHLRLRTDTPTPADGHAQPSSDCSGDR